MIFEHALNERQRAVANRAMAEEESRRSHVVIALSGAHAYGFPSPDSDLDLKGIHLLPTSSLIGLQLPVQHADRMEMIDGVEIDYSSNELGLALAGIVKGNGNFLERVLGTCVAYTTPEHAALVPLVQACVSKRVHRHYLGFATSQLRELHAADQKTAKRVLYVLRTTLTGVHALLTGEIVADVSQLLDEHGFAEARSLIERKRAGERVALSAAEVEALGGMLNRAFAALEDAAARSVLPEEPTGVDALEAWLIELRRRRF